MQLNNYFNNSYSFSNPTQTKENFRRKKLLRCVEAAQTIAQNFFRHIKTESFFFSLFSSKCDSTSHRNFGARAWILAVIDSSSRMIIKPCKENISIRVGTKTTEIWNVKEDNNICHGFTKCIVFLTLYLNHFSCWLSFIIYFSTKK